MPVSRHRFVIAAAALLLLLAVSGCTLAGAEPAPLTTLAPGDMPEFEPVEPASEGGAEGDALPTPTQVAPVDVFGTQTATAPTEGEGAEPTLIATPLGEETGEPAATEEVEATEEGTATEEAEATTVPSSGSCPTAYTVQAGDTLYSIARANGLTTNQVIAANNITNPDALSIGDELTIPCSDGSGVTAGGETTTSGGETVYIVQPGDNLFRIALRYGLTTEQLASYNNITNVTQLSVGQEILIPPTD